MVGVPSVEFDARKIQRDIRDAQEDLDSRKLPVIAWLIIGEGGYEESCHAVVITQIDRTSGEITYLDPWDGEKTESLIEFSQKWEKADKWLVRLIFARRENKQIEEFAS